MKITVFTPTYNRAYIIKNLYDSLKRQTFTDFEWVVVDDGSIDNTENLFADLMSQDNGFPIIYKKTENGGKHRAINCGVKLAQGELFFIVDSDDYITDDALEQIAKVEESIHEEQKGTFAGVCGLKAYKLGENIGQTFEGDYLDITTLEREKYRITGDKAEVFYTHILKKYPFPQFEGEKFVTECVVWDKIAADGYKLRFFNRQCMICNYLEDGLTAKYIQLLWDNPQGYGLYIHQCILYGKIPQGLPKWNKYLEYYVHLRNKYSFCKIAKFLHINPVKLWLRLFFLRAFYKLYSK